MSSSISINPDNFSYLFWDTIINNSILLEQEKIELFSYLNSLEKLKLKANKNTGSCSYLTCFLLYSLALYFNPSTIVEVGSYIGRSLSSLMLGAKKSKNDNKTNIFAYCCDLENHIVFPKLKGVNLEQFHKKTSYEMFKSLDCKKDIKFDIFHFDGRIMEKDLKYIKKFCHSGTIFIFDDFETIEKGVVNYNILVTNNIINRYKSILAKPPSDLLLKKFSLFGKTTTACVIPFSIIKFGNQ